MVNLNEVNLNRLVTFNAVIEAGSFTAAAARLGLAKTMVSKHMQLLEAEIGVNLLVRSTRKLSLTEAGLAFHEACVEILNRTDQAIVQARTGVEAPSGTLRVAAPIDYGAMVVAPVLVELQARFPALKIELVCADHYVDLIKEGIDVAVRLGKLVDSGLIATRVGSYVKWVVASPAFIAAYGRPETPEMLADFPYVVLNVLPQPHTVTLLGPDDKKQVIRMAITVFTSNTVNACRAAVLAGCGISVSTDFSVEDDVKAGRLQRLLPEWTTPTADIHAIFQATPHRQQKVNVFVDALKTALSG